MTGLTPSRCDPLAAVTSGDQRRADEGGGAAGEREEAEGLGRRDPALGLVDEEGARRRLQRAGGGAEEAAGQHEDRGRGGCEPAATGRPSTLRRGW